MTAQAWDSGDLGAKGLSAGDDALHGQTRPETWWTTTNIAEAAPGVQTPLGWSMWSQSAELALRGAFYAVGALSRAEAGIPADPADRVVNIFRGRLALRIEHFCTVGDRIPGRRGSDVARQVLSFVPPGRIDRSSYRHYPRVVAKSGLPMTVGVRRARANRAAVARFWTDVESRVRAESRLRQTDDETLRRLLAQAQRYFCASQLLQMTVYLGAVQPAFQAVQWLADKAAVDAHTLMAGHGNHDESAMVGDLWECSRNRLPVTEVLAHHGYHGPDEGNVFATSWREDPAPVHTLIERYRRQPDDAAPSIRHDELCRKRVALQNEVLAGLPRRDRPGARLALRFAAHYLPLRGLSKSAFVMSLDAARALTREIGARAAGEGYLDQPDDAFFLTLDELIRAPLGDSARDTVARRRSQWNHYRAGDIPGVFQGDPPQVIASEPVVSVETATITGTGASPGVAEGTARVLSSPDEDFDDGDILIARYTDPGWASIMCLSGGLVSDIGGVMSHTAVVARELGIPCIVDTHNATTTIRDGDTIRIDGATGTIDILKRA